MFYGWWIVGVAMLAQAISTGVAIYSYGLLVMPISTEFGASRLEIMWGKTGSSLMAILISPLLGAQLDRRSTRLLMTLGGLALGTAMLLIALSRNVWEFMLAFALFTSFSTALLGPLGTSALVARWFSTKRGRALSLAALGSSIGGLLIPYLFQALIDGQGWRAACLWIAAGSVALSLPVILLLVRNRPADLGLNPDGADTAAAASAQTAPVASVDNLLRSGLFWRIALAVGAALAAYGALLVNLVPFAQGQGIVSKQAALLVSMIAVTGLAGKLLFSFVADRINLKTSLLVAMLLVGLPILALSQTSSYVVMLICAIFIGIAAGGLMPAWGALLARIYGPQNYGRVMGRMLPVTGIMATALVPLVGYLFDLTGSYRVAFYFLAGLVVAAAVLLAPMRHGVSPAAMAPSGAR